MRADRASRRWPVAARATAAAALMLGAAPAAEAQGCADSARFLAATARHRVELQDLLQSRGMRRLPPPAGMTASRVASLIDEHYDGTDSLAVLVYGIEGGRLAAWLVSRRGLEGCAEAVAPVDTVEAAIAALRASLGVDAAHDDGAARARGIAPPRPARALPLDHAVARATDLLLPSALRPALARFPALVIVPVRGLGTVPFALLRPGGDSTVLASRSSVAVAASLYDVFQRVDDWSPPRSALVVGDPRYAAHPRFLLPRLPGAAREAAAVARRFGTTALTGAAATEDTVRRLAAGGPELLYLATHGVADPEAPLDGSFVALAPGSAGDGWWTAREVQHASLAGTQLVVLSACQTGLGAAHDAGVVGMARAFQLAGVPRVVVSLWNVDDAITEEFMDAFMALVQEHAPNDALRLAMLRVRARHPDPRAWAAFTLFGTVR